MRAVGRPCQDVQTCFKAGVGHSRGKNDRRRLLGSKWTALAPRDREKHFEVVEARRDGTALLVCVLTGGQCAVAVAELDDDERWRPGWH